MAKIENIFSHKTVRHPRAEIGGFWEDIFSLNFRLAC
jgi:hypothetical protein